jgi:hypothetical protein
LLVGAAVAIVALVVCLFGLVMRPAAFWAGYLAAVTFWLAVGLGCLGTALLHSLTGGRWGEAIGLELRAGFGPLAVGVAAVIPLAFGAAWIYPAGGSSGAAAFNAHQERYFAPPWVIGRIVLYAIVWLGLAAWLLWAHGRNRSTAYATAVSPRRAAVGILAFWLATTFAAVDGLMSLTPHWASSMFPLMVIVGAGVAGLAFAIAARSVALSAGSPTEPQRRDTHDLGNMLQAYNMMWTYLAFSQYLIIWSGDIASEVKWYLDRREPLMIGISMSLFLLHFAVPFLLLLSRNLKRDPRKLATVAGLLLAMRLVADAWIVLPSSAANAAWAVALTVACAIVIGAASVAAFVGVRRRLPAIEPATGEQAAGESTSHAGEASP